MFSIFKKCICIGVVLLLCAGCATIYRPWTMQEKQIAVLSCVATAADAYTTISMLDNPDNYEMNPILGKHPGDGKVVFVLGITQVLSLVFVHYFPDLRIPFLGLKSGLNAGCAVHNTSLY